MANRYDVSFCFVLSFLFSLLKLGKELRRLLTYANTVNHREAPALELILRENIAQLSKGQVDTMLVTAHECLEEEQEREVERLEGAAPTENPSPPVIIDLDDDEDDCKVSFLPDIYLAAFLVGLSLSRIV